MTEKTETPQWVINVVHTCMGLQRGEKILIVVDEPLGYARDALLVEAAQTDPAELDQPRVADRRARVACNHCGHALRQRLKRKVCRTICIHWLPRDLQPIPQLTCETRQFFQLSLIQTRPWDKEQAFPFLNFRAAQNLL